MSEKLFVDHSTLEGWFYQRMAPAAVEQQLQSRGLDKESITSHLKEYRKICQGKRQFSGFVCMAIGAFLGFVSCVLSITNPIPELFNVILYGLTSIAIILIGRGMYCVFE